MASEHLIGELWIDRDGHYNHTNPTWMMLLSFDGSFWSCACWPIFKDVARLGGAAMKKFTIDEIDSFEYAGIISTQMLALVNEQLILNNDRS